MEFSKKNLPVLVRLKEYEPILNGLAPMINKAAHRFNKTDVPSSIMDEDDYKSEATVAIIEAVNSFKLPPYKDDGEFDYDKCLATFLTLCNLKINSRLIDRQKKNYLPFQVSQKIARLHPKAKAYMDEMLENSKHVTVEDIMAQFKVSETLALELMALVAAEFSLIDQIVDTPDEVVKETVDKIFVEELLSKMTPIEREFIEEVWHGDTPIETYAKQHSISLEECEKMDRILQIKGRALIS